MTEENVHQCILSGKIQAGKSSINDEIRQSGVDCNAEYPFVLSVMLGFSGFTNLNRGRPLLCLRRNYPTKHVFLNA